MQKTKLARLLRLFSAAELERLRLFAQSPFFNTNTNIIALLDFLLPFAPAFDHDDMNVGRAYSAIFGHHTRHEAAQASITKLASKLTQLAKQFIAQQSLLADDFDTAAYQQKWFKQKHANEWEEAALRDMQAALSQYPLRDEYYAHCTYRIAYDYVKLNAVATTQINKIGLEPLSKLLDKYYLRAKMECVSHLANQALVIGTPFIMPEAEAVNTLLELRANMMEDALVIWQKSWHLLTNPSDALAYQNLKSAFGENWQYLSRKEQQTIFLYLNHTARFVFVQPDAYFSELHALYQDQIAKDCLLTDGFLHTNVFYNIITLAIRQRDIVWAAQFFEEYKDTLDRTSENREAMLLLCKGIIKFEQKAFGESLDALNAASLKDIQGKLAERRLRLKIYHELKYHDLFMDQVNTFRKFLSVNKSSIPAHHNEGCLNFIQAAVYISKLGQNKAKNQEALRALLETTAIMPERYWIEAYL